MNDGATAVHGSALVVGSSYRWCAAGSGGWALAPITGTAGAGLGCPGVRPFRVEDDDASMTSAAALVRRVLLRVAMVGAQQMSSFQGPLYWSSAGKPLGRCAPTYFKRHTGM